ncbi:hypothetical protein E1B28_013650 [Marasmius oreades]|uniref:Glucose-methanol-choline oxidoreductase N-terminal domain-containing protein n=1 Tax=Marasmius oreades TaxID=181124 RepID=A0A9P7RRF7_9AGAR|nr:uncharacterized protein E1B28_013650 [Marasmius oreades]KAG7087703.1 hypothetical protein E1B28_013650 [Marasmius oreades]
MSDPTTSSYDFVIVGGGTAGSVVASRLSEDFNVTVCVLEAGKDNTCFGFRNLGRPDILWPFTSVPQPFANDRVVSNLRGKALGGCSTVNLLTAMRGNAAEYDAYETLGNNGWNWKNLLPYFQKSETHTVTPEDRAQFGVELNMAYHGTDGPIHRTFPKWTSSGLSHYFEAMKSLGYKYNKDPCDGDNSGVWPVQFSIHATDAVRTDAASGYLKPAEKRDNLHVLTGTYVTKIILEQHNGLAVAEGVEYIKDGETFRALAKREVILCAGAYKSPQILEISGIGDSKILKEHGLQCHVNLPGRFDHFWCSFTAETTAEIETHEVLFDRARAAQEWELYEKTKSGLLATNLGGSGFTMLPCVSFMDKDKFANLRAEASKLHPEEYEKVANVRKKWLTIGEVPFLELAFISGFMPTGDQQPEPGKKYVSCFIAIQHPFARGTVHIGSADPSAAPNIDPRLLDNKVDMGIMVEAIKFVRRIFASGEFKGTTKEIIPGVSVSSDEELEKFVRDVVQTVWHPIGTASMLPREDGGVVDASLKVYGTANLRVMDASIMPIHISGHPMLTVYAIAEKAADMIKSSYV